MKTIKEGDLKTLNKPNTRKGTMTLATCRGTLINKAIIFIRDKGSLTIFRGIDPISSSDQEVEIVMMTVTSPEIEPASKAIAFRSHRCE